MRIDRNMDAEALMPSLWPVLWTSADSGETSPAYLVDHGAASDEPATIFDSVEGRLHHVSNDDLRLDPIWLREINKAFGRAREDRRSLAE